MRSAIDSTQKWLAGLCFVLAAAALQCGPADCDECPDGFDKCGDGCADFQTDHRNCGSCGRQCDSGEICVLGMCATSCQGHLSNCSGKCVNLETDPANCGNCNQQCNSGEVCVNRTCATSCQGHLSNCSGKCVDLQNDRANCGNCDRQCDPGQICVEGFCTANCGTETTLCGDVCVDTRHDPAHCGGCNEACLQGQVCVEGACQDTTCQPCPDGQTLCMGWCVDLTSDPFHCGNCGTACGADEACVMGTCLHDAFRIDALETSCWIVDDTAQIDSARGPIAFGEGMLHYGGAALVLGYDFVGGYAVQRATVAIPTLTSDLADGRLWSLGDGQGLVQNEGTTVTHIVPIEGQNQLQSGTPLALSDSFVLPAGAGLFAGFGKVGVHTGTELVLIDTGSGAVSRSPVDPIDAAACQGPFFSGVLEQHADGLRMTYVQANTDAVVRTRPSDGATQVVLQGSDFADMCGLAVNLAQNRWCFHLSEPSSEFDTQPNQSMALCCEAAFTVDVP